MLMGAFIAFPEGIRDHKLDSAVTDSMDSTFATNLYNYKLSFIVYTTRDGRTRIKAIFVLLFEDQESFEWVLRTYGKAFGSWMRTLLTDGDYALRLAIIAVLGEHFARWCHQLCVWHFSRNVVKHVEYLFGNVSRGKRGGGEGVDKFHSFMRMRMRPHPRISFFEKQLLTHSDPPLPLLLCRRLLEDAQKVGLADHRSPSAGVHPSSLAH